MSDTKFCPNCGAKVEEEGIKFCSVCGASLTDEAAPVPPAAQPGEQPPLQRRDIECLDPMLGREFGGAHQRCRNPLAAGRRIDRQMMHPAPHAVEAGHDGADDFRVLAGDEKKFGLHGELGLDEFAGFVPRRVVRKHRVPEGNQGLVVGGAVGADA